MLKYGVIQGRLVPQVGDFVQNFPYRDWISEFKIASQIGCSHIEWIYDGNELNPLMNLDKADISYFRNELNVDISAVCYDAINVQYAQNTWKEYLVDECLKIAYIRNTCKKLGIRKLIIPLLEYSSIMLPSRLYFAAEEFGTLIRNFDDSVILSFETDLDVQSLLRFIDMLQSYTKNKFGITFDTGNLLRMGYSLEKHVAAYGHMIDNIHIKDALKYDRSVPLGTGELDMASIRKITQDTGVSRVTFQTCRTPNLTGPEIFINNKQYMETAYAFDS